MAIPIINQWKVYFSDENEGLGSSYERIVLNNLLRRIVAEHNVENILEAPCFGFTGLSGINSIQLASDGKRVTLVDNKSDRIVMMEKVWQELGLTADIQHSQDFDYLPFKEGEYDLSWNFSALWFAKDLDVFLKELNRVTSKAILLTVPNRTGLGYLWQVLIMDKSLKGKYQPKNIRYKHFNPILESLGWRLKEDNYIDCPPWPDIGMKKEDLLRKIGLKFLVGRGSSKKGERITIMDYYRGQDDKFPDKMMKHYWFERLLPRFLKMFWAHHHYYLYIRE
ncbi:MAG: methyltransferase domain-containing protein [Candidatus Cloacimonadia bacterium]